MTTSVALVPATANGRPSSFDLLERGTELAEYVAGTDFVPKSLRGNPPAILAAILYGHELGIEPMTSLSLIAVIEGKPTVSAEGQRAMILAAGHEIWHEESTNTRAVYAGRRKGDANTVRVTWTLDDAKRAGIGGRPNWQRYPRQMLLARASAELARQLFADVIRGLAATEELEDVVEAELVDEAEQPQPSSTRRRRRPTPSTPPESPLEPEPEPAQPDPPNAAQLRKMFALFRDKLPPTGDKAADRTTRIEFTDEVLGRKITSSNELSSLDVTRVIEALEAKESPPVQPDAGGDELPADEQAFVDEARDLFDATDVPPLPGEGES